MSGVAYSDADRLKQEDQALDLRLRGYSYARISDEIGVAPQTALRRVDNALQRYRGWKADGVRELETGRLERIISHADAILCSPTARPVDKLSAMNVMIKASERMSRLHGADAPVRVEATVSEVTQADLELAEMIRETRARAADPVVGA